MSSTHKRYPKNRIMRRKLSQRFTPFRRKDPQPARSLSFFLRKAHLHSMLKQFPSNQITFVYKSNEISLRLETFTLYNINNNISRLWQNERLSNLTYFYAKVEKNIVILYHWYTSHSPTTYF